MPASRWTGWDNNNFHKPSSYTDDDEELNGDESIRSNDEGTFERSAGDDISALASQVLADLEAFFDHELCEEGKDNAESESDLESEDDGGKQNQWRSAAAISLEELSVVLNASIQRHQPRASVEMKASRAISSDQEKPRVNDKAKASANGQHHELPFAHFQHLLEQKTQLFREKCHESRRKVTRLAPPRDQGKPQPKRQQRQDSSSWRVGSRSGGSSCSSFDDDEAEEGYSSDGDDNDDADSEEEQSSESEESVDSVASSIAASDDNRAKKTAARDRRTASLSPPTKRDALTQATLMQDQGQQTSISKNRKPMGYRFSMHPSQPEHLKSQTVEETHEDEEFKCEGGDGDKREVVTPTDDRALQAKWSLSLQSLDSFAAMGSTKASAKSNSMASSSSSMRSYCSDNIERLTRIHHSKSENSRAAQNANPLREAESQTTPAKTPVATAYPHAKPREQEQEENNASMYYHEARRPALTPLPLPHLKPSTWELDLSNFNA